MNKWIKTFPDGTVKRKDKYIHEDVTDNPEFRKRFWIGFRDAVVLGFLFALGLVLAGVMLLTGYGNAD